MRQAPPAGPPPERPTMVSKLRQRRSGTLQGPSSRKPLDIDMRDLGTATTGLDAAEKAKIDQQASSVRSPSQRESMLLRMQPMQEDNYEHANSLMALQQNVTALTACNQREKERNDHLLRQLQILKDELKEARDTCDDEKAKNEKITILHQQKPHSDHGTHLPGIHSAAVMTAALQQQTQLEITYQRKILALESRYKDMSDNNKRLIKKIEQLQKIEADAGALVNDLRQENLRLASQVDNLSSTVSSQTSLILGLRASLQKLTQEEHHVATIIKKYDRCQIDLEVTKAREKMLRDEHEKTTLIMSREKETLMSKIMEFQQRLQESNRVEDTLEAFRSDIRRLELENRSLVDEVNISKDGITKAEKRMHQQEQTTNRLLQENEVLQREKRELLAKSTNLAVEVETHSESVTFLQAKLLALEQKGTEVAELMHKLVDLQESHHALEKANANLHEEIDNLRQLNLSQDETVRALQLARQKTSTHEALMLVNEEKKVLEENIAAMKLQFEDGKAQYDAAAKRFEEEAAGHIDKINALQAEIALSKQQPVKQGAVEDEIPSPQSGDGDANEQLHLAADLDRMRSEYDDLRENLDSIGKEYNKLVTKKYKTESFQSQVRLLQNENSELSTRLDGLVQELEESRAKLHSRTMEVVELKGRAMDPQVIEILRKTQESLEVTVSSLVEAETASETTFTCLQCMRLFVSPMTLTPCGHTYCSSCMAEIGDVADPSSIRCKECGESEIRETMGVFANKALEDLTKTVLPSDQGHDDNFMNL